MLSKFISRFYHRTYPANCLGKIIIKEYFSKNIRTRFSARPQHILILLPDRQTSHSASAAEDFPAIASSSSWVIAA